MPLGSRTLWPTASRDRPSTFTERISIDAGANLRARAALQAVLQDTSLEKAQAPGVHDAVVIGAGAAGGLAALLLTEAGLRVLVLDAGKPRPAIGRSQRDSAGKILRHLAGPAGLRFIPRPFVPVGRAVLRALGARHFPIQSQSAAWARSPGAFVKDHECPYEVPPGRPFLWLRSRQLGGRMALPGHGRQYYRLGPDDFACPDGLSEHWPLSQSELDPWYDCIESRLDLSGRQDGVPWQPDSRLAHVLEPSADEIALIRALSSRWPGSRPILGRFAPAMNVLEQAALTGRLSCRAGAVVREITVDNAGKVTGAIFIDHATRSEARVAAPLVFLCGSALESTRLLLLSRGPEGAAGLGSSSGVLGRGLMDHVLVTAWASGPPLKSREPPVDGRSIYVPRFDARADGAPKGRGFGVQVYQFPAHAGRSHFIAAAYGEMVPHERNRVTIAADRRDAWGIPVLRIDCGFGDAELSRAREQADALVELIEAAGARFDRYGKLPEPPGSASHECGTARMGRNSTNSVFDPFNQCWEARGLYLTDGACFPSQGSQNPTLTILALTARACDHALRGT
jgi:choline dehydrogenase-like flavoprotein